MAQKVLKKDTKKKKSGKSSGLTKRHNYVPMSHRRQKKSSSTPGRSKTTCVVSPYEKSVCKTSRSYKWKDYNAIFQKIWRRAKTPGVKA